MSEVKLGLGLTTGMFYHAPKGTALPTDPENELSSAWTHVGDVTDDGITLAFDKSTTPLRNWANVVKRVIMTEHNETIQSPIMETTAEALKVVVGEDNVSESGGVVKVNLSSGSLPPEEAFLWLMKDGDDLMGIGCEYGQVSAVDNVTFAPNDTIKWTPTITAMGDDGFVMIMKEAEGATGTT